VGPWTSSARPPPLPRRRLRHDYFRTSVAYDTLLGQVVVSCQVESCSAVVHSSTQTLAETCRQCAPRCSGSWFQATGQALRQTPLSELPSTLRSDDCNAAVAAAACDPWFTCHFETSIEWNLKQVKTMIARQKPSNQAWSRTDQGHSLLR
jgi:hypothetical protein